MGREVRRTHKNFEWPLKKTWWGYLLDSIPCQSCTDGKNSKGEYCTACEGEKEVWPKVEPRSYEVDKLPSYYQEGSFSGHEWGWQMWEITSEGSPISPVCDTPEDLARWLADNQASSFGRNTATYEQWLAMIGKGYAISALLTPMGLISGVEAITEVPDA